MSYALEVIDVYKRYQDKFLALENINFKIKTGDFVGLLGVNGAGKTSLISAIAGINNFDGQIKVAGYDVVKNVINAKKNLGVVPQELAFDPFLTVYQTLKLQAGLYGVSERKEWIDEIIERLFLTDKIHTNTRALSGGMKRRLMVAQALVHQPSLIILDEPTTGVDVEIRQSLWGFIAELHAKGHTILLTTHYLEEVERLCNQIIMINKGKIISQTSKEELIKECSNLGTSLEIQTFDGKFVSSLEHLIINKNSNIFTLKLNDTNELIKILNILQEQNIEIENVEIKKPSLEDMFIHFIRR